MEFLIDYGLFLAKAVTIVIAIGFVLMLIAGFSKGGSQSSGLQIDKLNDKLREMSDAVRRAMLNKAAWKKHEKAEKKERKQADKSATAEDDHRKRIFVIDFKGDIRATGVVNLREEISAVVSTATASDEVVLRLENPGGAVHEHGLAASQLLRIKDRGIPLTVIVDKVAASGGYLMACIANRIIAARFAVIGSIGVIAQLPNFNRALEERGVDFEQVTAGKYKRTVTMFGKNTDEDRAKLREELEDVHTLFKGLVAEQRPSLDIEKVATGEHWYGSHALDLGLIDEIGTSDDYLIAAAENADVYTVKFKGKQSLSEKIMQAFESSLDRAGRWIENRFGRDPYP